MHLIPCDAPNGQLEPAPVTSFAINMNWSNRQLSAFWTIDDQYIIRSEEGGCVAWYRFHVDEPYTRGDEDTRLTLGALMADVIPLGIGRVVFPVGSTGRRVYRGWRTSGKTGCGGRTRILAVRAARSRHLPA